MRDSDLFDMLFRIEAIEDFLDDMMDFRSVLREKKEARQRAIKQIKENPTGNQPIGQASKLNCQPPPVKEVGESKIYYCQKCGGDYELCGGCKAHM
jgi:hypothetical protein